MVNDKTLAVVSWPWSQFNGMSGAGTRSEQLTSKHKDEHVPKQVAMRELEVLFRIALLH